MGIATALQAAPTARERFYGVWKIVSCKRTSKDGTVDYPFGENPVGRITYDKAGRMSAQLMKSGRPSTLPPGVDYAGGGNTSTEELLNSVRGFVAYFGTFDVDESTQTVTHHVQACLVSSWVGHDVKRNYRFSGNRLILRAAALATTELTWEREPD